MYFRKALGVLFAMTIGMAGLFAQIPQQMPQQQPTEVSDNEIAQFASAFREIQDIDQQVQQEMMSAVQEEGIDVQRFNEYLNSQQDPVQEIDASAEELEQFADAFQEIEEIQKKAQLEMEKAITQNELTIERYQVIATSIQADPELLQKLQQHFEE